MNMNITIKKEKKNQYLVSMKNDLGIHAVGETPALALEYFIDVYAQTMALKKEIRHFVSLIIVNEVLV